MPDQPRPVWLTREQRDTLALAYDAMPDGGSSPQAFRDVVDAWDAAPADPAEAASEAVGVEFMGLDDEECHDAATAVLRALGMPDA